MTMYVGMKLTSNEFDKQFFKSTRNQHDPTFRIINVNNNKWIYNNVGTFFRIETLYTSSSISDIIQKIEQLYHKEGCTCFNIHVWTIVPGSEELNKRKSYCCQIKRVSF